MTEASVRIQKLKLRLRGIDEATARSLASGLGDAIAAAVDVRRLRGATGRQVDRVDLGSIETDPGVTPGTLRGQVAAAMVEAVGEPAAPRTGGGA